MKPFQAIDGPAYAPKRAAPATAAGLADRSNTSEHPSHLLGWFVPVILVLLVMLSVFAWGLRTRLDEIARLQDNLVNKVAQMEQESDASQLDIASLQSKIALADGGATGEDSAAGAQGDAGPAGADGSDGADGADGATGAAGADGQDGANACIDGLCVSRQTTSPGTQEIGNINISGAIIAGSIDAGALTGDGSGITNLDADNIDAGTLADARLSSNVSLLGSSIQDAEVDNNLTISAAGSVDWTALTNYPAACPAGEAVTTIGDTLTCTAFAADSGSNNYIQNQSAADQSASFRIDGTGRAGTAFQAPLFDTATAAGLGIGNTNATSVSICNSAACDTISIGTNADADVINIGDANDTVTITGNSSSTFVLDGVTLSTAELNILDGGLVDSEISDTLTIDSSSSVDWTALTNYPAACAAGSAVSTLADVPTCTAFNTDTSVDLDNVYDNDADHHLTVDHTDGLTFDLTTTGDFVVEDGGSAFATFDDSGGITFAPNGTSDLTLTGDADSGMIFSGSTTDITTGTDEDFVIDPNGTGNVGINTTDPQRLLEIKATGLVSGTNDQLQLSSQRNAITTNHLIGGLEFVSDDTNLTAPGLTSAYIRAEATSAHSATSLPTRLVFGTTATNATAPTEALRIDSTGFVGIGGITPDEPLHVAEAVDGDSVVLLLENSLTNSAASTNETAQLRFGFGGDNDVARLYIGKESDYSAASENDSFMAFYTDTNGTATEQLRIDSAGNVGINTTAPQRLLEVKATGVTSGTHDQLHLSSARAGIGSNSLIGGLEFVSDDTNLTAPGSVTSYIRAEGTDTHSIGTLPTRLVFGVTASGSDTPTEALRINSTGFVGIGGITPDEPLHVAEAVDGDSVLALLENSQANAVGSTNETAQLRFGFGGDNDVARILVGKESDYSAAAENDSFMAFYTDVNGSATERLRITSAGNVGIGTVDPQRRLEIKATGTISGTHDQLQLSSQRVGIDTNEMIGGLEFVSDDTSFAAPGLVSAYIRAEADGSDHLATSLPTRLVFGTTATNATAPTEAMRIDRSGNVSIGDTVPDARLDVEFATPTTDIVTINDTGSGTTTSGVDGLQIDFAQGADALVDTNHALNIAASTTADSTDIFNGINVNLANASTAGTQRGLIITNAENAANATTEALIALNSTETTADLVTDYLIINTSATDTTTDAIDVSDSGFANALNIGANIIVGTTGSIDFTNFDVASTGAMTFTGVTTDITTGTNEALTIAPNGTGDVIVSADADTILHVNGSADANIFRLQDTDGTCDYNPEAASVTVTCSSDERLKSNVQDAASGLDYLNDFRVRDYTITASGDEATGVIAQELLETHPELVHMGEDGILRVEQPSVWKIVKAIQELDGKIDGLDGIGNGLTLADGEEFKFNNADDDRLISFDSQGNATFAGTVTADKIKANQIEGLEIYTNKIMSLSSVQNSEGTATSNNEGQASTDDPAGIIQLGKINIESAKVALDLSVGGDLTASGGLTVGGPAEFKGTSVFHKLVSFVDRVVFRNNVEFEGSYVGFSGNIRGINEPLAAGAVVRQVVFPTPHPDSNYAVQCTPNYDTTCFISNKSAGGFTVHFGTAAPADTAAKFDWFVTR